MKYEYMIKDRNSGLSLSEVLHCRGRARSRKQEIKWATTPDQLDPVIIQTAYDKVSSKIIR